MKDGKENLLQKIGKTYKQRKFRFPVAQHLNQAGRPLSTPHGGRNYIDNR